MNNRILIVSAAEGFIIKGLETKLQGLGLVALYSPPMIKNLKGMCDDTDLVIIFTDDKVLEKAEALVYIKDYCSEKSEQIVVVGAKEEYDVLKGYVPGGLIYKFYERPLDMQELVNDLSKYMQEDSQITRRKSILIVDDDVSYMSIIMEWLKDDYRISMANSGIEAITWLAKNQADLILLDYEMPVTTGPVVLEMIRSSAETADIPVMFLTGKGDKESIMSVLALKPVGYLLKTVDRRELKKKINQFFATHI